MLTFDNYIFDLYGTLMDIHTDEGSDELWESVCDYLAKELPAYFQGKNRELIRRPEKLKELYEKLDKEERKALGARLGTNYPEIRIEWVWERILEDSISQPIAASIPITHYRFEDDNIVPEHLAKLCTFFRRTSRTRMKLYPEVEQTLKTLKSSGKKIFLLSNAQRTFTRDEITECGLPRYMDDIFMSSDKLIMKPDIRYMEMLLNKHALDKSKCVMIGNEIQSDIKIAKDIGMHGILVSDGDLSSIL